MPVRWLEPSSGQQKVGNHLLCMFRERGQVVWILVTWALLEGALGRWRVPWGIALPFLPPRCPTGTVCSSRLLYPSASKDMLLTLSVCGSNSLCSLHKKKLLFQTWSGDHVQNVCWLCEEYDLSLALLKAWPCSISCNITTVKKSVKALLFLPLSCSPGLNLSSSDSMD